MNTYSCIWIKVNLASAEGGWVFAFTAEASDVLLSSLEREIETFATGDFSSFCEGY